MDENQSERPEAPLLSKLLRGAAVGAEEARERILRTAVEQISDFGVRGFTVDELAKRVGLSRVTIYRHFPSKSEVLEAALLHELRRFIAQVQAIVDRYDTLDDTAVEGFVFAITSLRKHAVFQRLLRTEPELILPLLTTQGSPVIEAGREFILSIGTEQVTRGNLRVEPTQLAVLAEMLARLIVSLVLTPQSVAPVADEAELRVFAEEYITGIIRGFAAAPAA